MKKLILITIAFLFSFNALAQDYNFRSFFKTQKHEENTIGLSIPLGLINAFVPSEEKKLKNLLRKGKKARILVFDSYDKQTLSDIKKFKKNSDYEPFMTVKEEGNTIQFLVKENNEFINEIVIFIHEENEIVALGITGKFTYDDFDEFSDDDQF